MKKHPWLPEFEALLAYFPPADGEAVLFTVEHAGDVYSLIRRPVMSLAILSAREAQIVALVEQGLSNKMIANQLQLSPSSVATYLRRIFIKLNVSSRASMVDVAAAVSVAMGAPAARVPPSAGRSRC